MSDSFQSSSSSCLSAPTVSRIINRVTAVLSELKPRFIKSPQQSWHRQVADEFQAIAGFPNVIGCLGATHLTIKCPRRGVSERYMNENNLHSFRAMV